MLQAAHSQEQDMPFAYVFHNYDLHTYMLRIHFMIFNCIHTTYIFTPSKLQIWSIRVPRKTRRTDVAPRPACQSDPRMPWLIMPCTPSYFSEFPKIQHLHFSGSKHSCLWHECKPPSINRSCYDSASYWKYLLSTGCFVSYGKTTPVLVSSYINSN